MEVCKYVRTVCPGTLSLCSSIPVQSRGARSKWCLGHGNWTVSDRGNVMFTDESRFALEPDDKRIRIWRKQGTRNQPQNITHSEAEALCPKTIVRLYAATVGPTFVLMDDNARPHRADIVDDYLKS
ncbi:transposable element Tcb1 transposase [Trichonephila clavipes]|nr:transposable element Tcb1 transposase [Trichonephila clavipes]